VPVKVYRSLILTGVICIHDEVKDFLNVAVGGIISFNLNYFGLLFFRDFAICKKSIYWRLNQTSIKTLIEEIYEKY